MSIAALYRGAAASLLLFLYACATPPRTPPPAPAAPPVAPALDPSYDWHGLLVLPFGVLFKDVPLPLHEVLLFRDAAHAQGEDAECYAVERSPPRFLARTPHEYLLCFRHDHLARLEAEVDLPQQDAPGIFSDACDLWRRNAGAASGAAASETAANAPGVKACEGRDGAVAYAARLEDDAERPETALTIRLDALTEP